MKLAKIMQLRYRDSKQELSEAQTECQRLMPYYRKLMGPRRAAAEGLVVGEWLDEGRLTCVVTNPEKARSRDEATRARAETRVNLAALLSKDYGGACEKRCMQYDIGLCVHVIAGEADRKAGVAVEEGSD